MPPVKKPAKPNKPNEPKKPSSRSKTKNAECSQAASNWQLSLRGKATLSPETYQTLAKCRALASSQRKADSYGRTGKLSEHGKTALESRLQSRFESGLITDKSRKAKLADLLAKRKAAQGAGKSPSVAEKRAAETGSTPESRAKLANRLSATLQNRREASTSSKEYVSTGYGFKEQSARAPYDQAIHAYRPERQMRLLKEKTLRPAEAGSATPAPTPPKYSLGGQLAPGRGTRYRTQAAKDLVGIREAARKGDMKKVADLAERSLDMKVIPSKFDETKVAAIGRYRGARWESMTLNQLRKKMTEGERTYAWMASQKKR